MFLYFSLGGISYVYTLKFRYLYVHNTANFTWSFPFASKEVDSERLLLPKVLQSVITNSSSLCLRWFLPVWSQWQGTSHVPEMDFSVGQFSLGIPGPLDLGLISATDYHSKNFQGPRECWTTTSCSNVKPEEKGKGRWIVRLGKLRA